MQTEENLTGTAHERSALGRDSQSIVKRDARSRNRAKLKIDKQLPGYEPVTISARTDLYAKIKEIAYAENMTIKNVMEQVMRNAVTRYESIHGAIVVSIVKNGSDRDIFS